MKGIAEGKYCMMWTVLLLFASFISSTRAITTGNPGSADFPPVNLLDQDNFDASKSCGEEEECLERRTHMCTTTNSTKPHESCGNLIWKEELFGCYACAGDVWQDEGVWSKCVGTGCGDTVQSLERTCANKAVNPNCKQKQTRYCQADKICDGRWSTWSSEYPKCEDQCGDSRFRVMQRTCMKGDKPSSSCAIPASPPPMVDTYIDYCTNTPCRTTVATTTTTSTTTMAPTTTTEPITTTRPTSTFLSSWSNWEGCTATCEAKVGIETRTRKCMYENKEEATPDSCPGESLREERKCDLRNPKKCTQNEKSLTKVTPTTSTHKTTTSTTEMPDIEEKSVDMNRILPDNDGKSIDQSRTSEIPLPDIVTEPTVNVTNNATEVVSSMKYEHKVLIIVFVTTGCLILFVIVFYVFYVRKKKPHPVPKRKIGPITVVGLQSHTGFMDGVEKYGFTKSTVPVGDIFSTLPIENRNSVIGAVEERHMPEDVTVPVQENQNSMHIYEDMRHRDINSTGTENGNIQPLRRSFSHHDMVHSSSMSDSSQRRRQSCFVTEESHRRKSAPPPKPPRRSMLIRRADEPDIGSEVKEVPKYLYDTKQKMLLPDLGFVNHINPPAFSPPITPIDCNKNTLNLPNLAIQSHSAPVSPCHPQIGPQSPYIACVPNSFLLPYSGVPFMAPVPSPNGGVMYMPLSPIYATSPTFQLGQNRDVTPPQGTDVTLRNKSQKFQKRRPKTVAFLPQISISEANGNLLSPSQASRNSASEEYTDMSHLLSPSIPPDFDDVNSVLAQSASSKYLLGSPNEKPSLRDENSNKLSSPGNIPPEDGNGYLVPSKA